MMENPLPAPVHPILPPSLAALPTLVSALACPAASTTLARTLAQIEPTTLAGLDAVSLLNRIDTKFLLSEAQLGTMLPELGRDYCVLDVQGRRLHQYRTRYFDTPGFDLYRRHHAGEAVRYKARSRMYLESGLAFFEIKAKDERGRTIKHRVATAGLLTGLTPEARALLAQHAPQGERLLEPKLQNDFVRITLVGKCWPERLTFDLGIQFDGDGRTAMLPGAVIAELKQRGLDTESPFMRLMLESGQQPTSVSKYCIGVALLVQGVERVAFESKLQAFERLARGEAAAS